MGPSEAKASRGAPPIKLPSGNIGRLLRQGFALSCLLAPLIPGPAFAHASDRGHVLLLPTGHYIVGGALAVAASFFVLFFVRAETLEKVWAARLRLGGISGEALRLPLSLVSFGILAVLVAAGLFGSRDPLSNPLPLTIWTLVWVGLTLVQGMFGNLWTWINPWYGPWRVLSALFGRGSLVRPPTWIGMWPAAALFLDFALFELVYPAPDDPGKLAWAVGVYWLFSLAMMLIFGFDAWSRRGEFLSVFFGMVARFGIVARTRSANGNGELSLCLPGAKLAGTRALPLSGTLFLLFALASVSFDGL